MKRCARLRIAISLSLVTILAPFPTSAQSAPPPGTMTFALAGDAIISQRLSPYQEPEFLRLVELIRNADMAFVNLEVLLHTYQEGYPAAHSGGTWMAADPLMAHELVWAGFDMVSLANNHTMDYGAGGLGATMRALDAADLVYAGAGENLGRARAPAYRETRGGRVALISVASTFADEHRAGPQRAEVRGRPGLSPIRYTTSYQVSRESLQKLRDVADELGMSTGDNDSTLRFMRQRFVVGNQPARRTTPHARDRAEIAAMVRDARRQADWVIVTSHSHEGAESREVPAEFLVTFARAMIDAGADMFVGHGPHVLRGIEIHRGKPIFYSLANFVFQNETIRFLTGDFYDQLGLESDASPADGFDRRNERSSTGGFPGQQIYWESVVASPSFTDGVLTEVRLYPITLGFGKHRPQRGRPEYADPETGRKIIEKIAELSAPFGVEIEYVEAQNVGLIRIRET